MRAPLPAEESLDERLITIIGGSGFIGRHLVRRLAQRGYRLRIGTRRPERARFLLPLGDVGQIVPVQVNVRDDTSVLAALNGASAAVNLVGVLHNRGHQTFGALQAQGAGRVARLAKMAGVDTLVHLSAIGADAASRSSYARSKGEGEALVREAFARAVIVRPSLVFGPEDQFFNRFAALAGVAPFLPLFGKGLADAGATRFQPVFVGDVAAAIVACLENGEAAGQTYELGGPKTYTYRQIMELVLAYTGRRRPLVPVPIGLASIGAGLLQLLPSPPLTVDQLRLLQEDNVCSDAQGLGDLGVAATPLETVVPGYLARFRRGGNAVATPG